MASQLFELTLIPPQGSTLGNAFAEVFLVNTTVGANIYTITSIANVVTVTTLTAHGLSAGTSISLIGVTPFLYNGTYAVASIVNSTTFTFNLNGTYTGSAINVGSYVVINGSTNTVATVYSDSALTQPLVQPIAIVDNYFSFYADNDIYYDILLGGGNLTNSQLIQNIWALPSSIWQLDPNVWKTDPNLWDTPGTVTTVTTNVTNNVGQLYTGYDIIRAAMRLIQVSAVDVDLTASELKDGLESLNRMLDSWSLDELMLYEVKRETFPLIASQNPYTIGLGGIWNTIRPSKIVGAYLTLTNGSIPVDYPMQVINYDDYNDIRLKTLQTNFPGYLYYQPSFPIAECYIYPLYANNGASTAPGTITLTSWKPFSMIVDPSAPIQLPPGYWEAIVFNLSTRIAEEYQFDIRPTTVQLATAALIRLKRMNQRTNTLQTDVCLMNTSQMRYNIYSDGYGR